ncbi:type II toxin-antitoxin system Phd/YefM family antitoxin [Gordonia sp. (in: high G+C Gram-positive bacteria)]|uniref:type II toxin-antitoxin system Phd/YefM family antitoxin n=1 Tax=Gordonia sp. (in: high G+C Gram-positive bacteria) TaxID=84139 RepID=UPI003C74D058
MKTITVAQLRQNPTEALEAVARGERYVVTKHRLAVAHLVPVDDAPMGIRPAKEPGSARLREQTDLPDLPIEEVEGLLAEMEEDR